MSLRQTGIARLDETVKEYEQEKEIIRNAAAKFGVFLKHHSMSPINDATEGYLNFRIKAEEDKVSVGGNNTQLKALREDLLRHKQEMEVLTRALNSTTTAEAEDLTEAGVERTIRRLYQLKHFGKNLQTLQKGIMFAYEAGNREIPLSVKRNPVNASGRRPRKLEICSPTQFHNPSDGSRPSFAERQRANGNGDSTVTRFVKKSWSSMFG